MRAKNGNNVAVLSSAMKVVIASFAGLLLPLFCGAQQPLLQITSPASGSIVSPGQTVSISVVSPAGATFNQVDVIGEDPIGSSDIATSVPAQISLSIPPDIAEGKYSLVAEGTTTAGQDATSASMIIDVERSDLPSGLSPSLSTFVFSSQAQASPLLVYATFSDGTVLDVSRSSNLSYTSSNPQVAAVDGNGMVSAICAGTGSIIATYTVGGNSVQTSVPVHGPPSLITIPSALGFNAQDVGTNSVPQQVNVVNSGDSAVNILGVTTSGDFTETNSCSSLQSGDSCIISVTFLPTAVGTRTGSVNIANDSCQSPVQASMTGTGMADFSLSVTPSTQAVTLGSSATYNISIGAIGGYSGTVGLSVSGLPGGSTASFTPTSVSGGSGSSTLKITTSSKSTPLGTYTLSISAAGGSLAHSSTVTLTVNARH